MDSGRIERTDGGSYVEDFRSPSDNGCLALERTFVGSLVRICAISVTLLIIGYAEVTVLERKKMWQYSPESIIDGFSKFGNVYHCAFRFLNKQMA